MPGRFAHAAEVMCRAIELARHGIGAVEPNPPVGAVIVDDDLNPIAEGYHARHGGPHAEIEALARAGGRARGATMYVTLEPCCHQGKTGPCTEALAAAGIRKVVVAVPDPNPKVDGQGIAWLRARGIAVELGLLADEARRDLSPFLKLVTTARPWVIAKWAISLDGKIATESGDSRWISSEASRAIVHRLRGQMDAVIIGAGTAMRDDPLLTARPAGPRIAARIVVDSRASLNVGSQLVRTARDAPLLLAISPTAPIENVRRLERSGAEVVSIGAPRGASDEATLGGAETPAGGLVDVGLLLDELGRRQFTNVLIEGGARLLGSFFDARQVDEVHVFIAAKIVGGAAAPSAVAGRGVALIERAGALDDLTIERVGDDVHVSGRTRWPR